ncbi:alpha/beta hydrolase family esterase [Spirochaetota bacterium]
MMVKKMSIAFLLIFVVFAFACSDGTSLKTGEHSIISGDGERVFYLKLPEDYSCDKNYPIIFAYHGTGGSYSAYLLNDYYNLHGSVGEEAILVYPNAKTDTSGLAQWYFATDLEYFDDLYEYLESKICFDRNRVFAVGHSSGGGMVHFLGQKRGIFRGIAPVAGVVLFKTTSIGRTAVIDVHGDRDTLVMPTEGNKSIAYWNEINDCNGSKTPLVGSDGYYCLAYQDCAEGYPVEYCYHDLFDDSHSYGGHAWPDFAGPAIWSFFKGLPLAVPTENEYSLGGHTGDNSTLDFKIHFHDGLVGTPNLIALTLYPPESNCTEGVKTMPTYFLNWGFDISGISPPVTIDYNGTAIDLSGVTYGDHVLMAAVYVEGGGYPTPMAGVDYVGCQIITIDSNNTYILPDPIDLVFAKPYF